MVIRKLILISLLVLLAAGCDMELQIHRNDVENEEMEYSEVSDEDRELYLRIAEEAGFDWDSTVRVLDAAIGRQTDDALIVAVILGRAGVRGAIRAEMLEREPGQARFMEVESEDNRIYILGVTLPSPIFDNSNSFMGVVTIKDTETGELIYYIECGWSE